ncbi:hypothetical protein BJ170DRAFT_683755 [Xylariales sp. AK1849]|nr:hypothetical protein BJ170DRAFT_683755 [Xylariales sp. AK1849]
MATGQGTTLRQSDSGLCTLPSELRHRIYELCAVDYLSDAMSRHSASIWEVVCHDKYERSDFPALLLTCKHIAREAAYNIYGIARIRFDADPSARVNQIIISAPGRFKSEFVRNVFIELDVECEPHAFAMELSTICSDAKAVEFMQLRLASNSVAARTQQTQEDRAEKDANVDVGKEILIQLEWATFVRKLKKFPALKQIDICGAYPQRLLRFFQRRLTIKVVEGDRA